MVTKVFSIYDSKAQMFNVPFFMNNNAMAVRTFVDLVNDPKTNVSRHPEDYSLFEIGTFDDSKGVIVPATPINLGLASAFRNSTKPLLEVSK